MLTKGTFSCLPLREPLVFTDDSLGKVPNVTAGRQDVAENLLVVCLEGCWPELPMGTDRRRVHRCQKQMWSSLFRAHIGH